MANDYDFVLSLAAVDLLWDQLQLGLPPALFELPSVGETMDDRARLLDVVYRDLTSRNLASRGRLDPEVEEPLMVLGRFERAIEGVVLAEDEEPQVFRAATNQRLAVLARKLDQTVKFDVLRPEGLVHSVLGLIGPGKPGSGTSVSYPEVDAEPEPPKPAPGRHARQGRQMWPGQDEDAGYGNVLEQAQANVDAHVAQRRSVQTLLEKPRVKSGWFTVLGRAGREVRTSYLSWFDTEDGRYMAHRRPGPDGKPWATCSPADNARIGHQLAGMLNSLVTAGQ